MSAVGSVTYVSGRSIVVPRRLNFKDGYGGGLVVRDRDFGSGTVGAFKLAVAHGNLASPVQAVSARLAAPVIRLPPAGQTSVAMFRQGSPCEIRISKSRSRMRAPLPRWHKGRAA